MKAMPYKFKQLLRRYDNAVKKADLIHREIISELEKYGVPYDNVVLNNDPYNGEPRTEGLAFINNNEGDIEDNIAEIEEVFLHFANKKQHEHLGDRICPDCGEETLIEKGLRKWVCLNPECEEVFDEEFLDS